MSHSPPHQVEYAPLLRRRVVTRRSASLMVLCVAALLAAWVVLPRLHHRWLLLQAQRAVLDGRAALPPGTTVAESVWLGSRPAMMMPQHRDMPELAAFTGWGMGRPFNSAAFVGARQAAGAERIVVVVGSPTIYGTRQPPEVSLIAYVFDPGGWSGPPELVQQTVVGPLPLPVPQDSGWRLAVLSGQADPQVPSRFLIELEAGYEQAPALRRLVVVGHLMPDGSVRFDPPADATPAMP